MGEDKRARSWELRHGAGRAGIFRVPWELRLEFFTCRRSCAWVGAVVVAWGVV